MKKRVTRIMSLLLVTAIALGCSACGKAEGDGSSYYFEYETITTSNTDSTDSGSESSASNSSNASSVADNTGSQGSTNTSTSSAEAARDAAMSKMPSSLKGTTLTYMYWFDAKTQMEKEAIEGFEKDTGIKVNTVVASYSDFQTELNVRIASGNAPDLVRQIGNQQWMVANLQPITNGGYDFSEDVWDTWIMDQYTFNGKCYAANIKNSAILDVAVMYYNKKALRAADMDNQDPYKLWKSNPSAWTWEKFWSMCDEFVKANGNKSEYYGATFAYYTAYVRAMGGSLWNYDPTKGLYVSNANSQATIDGWKTTLEAYEKQWVKTDHDPDSFDRNRILFMWFGPYSARTNDSWQKSLKESGDLGVVPIPTDSKNTTLYELTAFGIPAGAKNAEAAPYYIRYVMDRSSYDWDNVYYSEEARDVLDYVTSQSNFFYGHSEISELRAALISGGSAQVKNVIKSYNGVIDQAIEDENNSASHK